MAAAGQVARGLGGSAGGIRPPRRHSAHPLSLRSCAAARRRLRSQHTGTSVLWAVAAEHQQRAGDVGAWGGWARSLRACVQRGVGGAAVGAALLLSATFTAPCLAVQTALPIPTEFPPLPEVQLPAYTTHVLPNGLRVFLLEDHELELIRGSLLIKAGARGDPGDKAGLASVTAAVQRSGGTVTHPGAALDQALDRLAASVEVGANGGSVAVSFNGLSEDTEELMRLFGEVIQQPAFPQDKLELRRSQLLDRLEHKNDDLGAISRRELSKVLYGQRSVFAREPQPAAVKRFTTDDLRAYHAMWERPDNAVLGICGDFHTDRMLQLVTRELGGWKPAPGQPATPPPVPNSAPPSPAAPPRILLLDKPGATQASVVMGELGTTLADPDVYSLDALNEVLNGFSGRLFNQVRSREGLVYSVAGGFTAGLDHPGTFVVSGQTSAPAKFVRAVTTVLDDATREPLPAAELQRAKDKTLNSFVFNFASNSQQLSRIIAYDLFGIDQRYPFEYRDNVQATDSSSVLGAAQRHLHPHALQIVVVGDAKSTQAELEALGMPLQKVQVD